MAMYAIAITPLICHHSTTERPSKSGTPMTPQLAEASVISRSGGKTSPPSALTMGTIPMRSRHGSSSNRPNLKKQKRHLGAALGTSPFVESYFRRKVSGWLCEVERLSSIAAIQPHPAYAAFTHGLISKWTYLARTIPDIEDLLQPLENTIRQQFLPSLTGQTAFNDLNRDLLALSTRLGGLGIVNPSCQATAHNRASTQITAPLVALILQQSHTLTPETKNKQLCARKEARTLRRQYESATASELKEKLPRNLQRALEHIQRRVPRAGYPPFQSQHMDSLSTGVHLEMLYAYDMDGAHLACLHIVYVELRACHELPQRWLSIHPPQRSP